MLPESCSCTLVAECRNTFLIGQLISSLLIEKYKWSGLCQGKTQLMSGFSPLPGISAPPGQPHLQVSTTKVPFSKTPLFFRVSVKLRRKDYESLRIILQTKDKRIFSLAASLPWWHDRSGENLEKASIQLIKVSCHIAK